MTEDIIKIYYETLPRNGKQIDWNRAINCSVKFQCMDIIGEFKILSLQKNGSKITYLNVQYNDSIFSIPYNSFLQSSIQKIFYPYTYKYTIGQHLVDEKRDFTIIEVKLKKEEKYNRYIKMYKYHCNKCLYNGIITESNLSKGIGCPCCGRTSRVVCKGINDIPTTDSWMIPYFQGGYQEAQLYSACSSKKIYPICPNCKRIKDKPMSIYTIKKCKSIGCKCSDGISYPEKFFISLLDQLNINYKWQLSKTDFDWCGKYKYDFYLIDYNYIVELHGEQHYRDANFPTNKKEQNKIDNIKQITACSYVDKYIIIDCRHSELNWIKTNIERSILADILNLQCVDFNKCEEFACKNVIKNVCEYYENNKPISTDELAHIYNLGRSTIIRYLNKGANIGWCTYNPKENMQIGVKAAYERNKKYVEVYKCDKFLKSYNSLQELERFSLSDFGEKLLASSVGYSYRNNKPYKGYTFKIYHNDSKTN